MAGSHSEYQKNGIHFDAVAGLTTAATVVVKSIASGWRARTFHGLLVVLLVSGPALRAQQTTDNLRRLARNPIGDAVKVPLAVYSYAIRSAGQFSPKWQISLQCTLIYPRKRK
jgi:hypothetical protein